MQHSLDTMKSLTLFVIICVVEWWSCDVLATVEEDEVHCRPQQVHLSYGQAPDQVVVMWATNHTCNAEVAYGTSEWTLDQKVAGTSQSFTDYNLKDLQVLHRVILTGLAASTTYHYRPISNRIGSGPFYFKSPPAGMDWSPELLVAGDLGPNMELLPLLSEVTLTGRYSAGLQLGGMSTYFSDINGTKGDTFMQGLEQVAAFMPYMTAPGDNETKEGQFPAYRHRVSMPGSIWPIPEDQLWYSFNLGPVHFVSFCTDIYFHGDKTIQQKQYEWLVKDLSEANVARDKRPWIVAFGHHPFYCTGSPDCDCAKNVSVVRTGLEDTLFYYGVDLVLQSHSQSYERMYPIFKGVVLSTNYTNPGAPVHIVTGTASATHVEPTPTVVTVTNGTNSSSNDSNDKVNVTDSVTMTAFRMVNGTQLTYGHLHIINATHAHWELLAGSTEKGGTPQTEEGKVLDTLWLVQEHHGKFQLKNLPDDVGEKIDQNLVASGGKPGVLNVHDPEIDAKEMLTEDDNRRLIIGVSFGAFVLMLVLVVVAFKLRRRGRRRVVRRWDTMDYKYGKTKLYAPTNDEEDEDDDFRDDNDFEVDIPDGSQQTTKLINGK